MGSTVMALASVATLGVAIGMPLPHAEVAKSAEEKQQKKTP